MKNFSHLEKAIGITFKDKGLLTQSCVHRSYINEHRDFHLDHNERLEFLGDAVLELIVTEHLFSNYPNPEGELTNWRASVVNAVMLSRVGAEIGLEEYLFLSKGESKDAGSKARNSILADALEALIGSIYIDQGWDKAKEFIHSFIIPKLPEIIENKLYLDPKSRFQEVAQERSGTTPHYKVIKEEGPDHDKHFTVGIYLEDGLVAKGNGSSKQEAQVDAAHKALKKKGWE